MGAFFCVEVASRDLEHFRRIEFIEEQKRGFVRTTLPETNIAPENRPPQFPYKQQIFHGCLLKLLILMFRNLGVSKNGGGFPPKSSILIEFSIINHPFWGKTPIFGNTHIFEATKKKALPMKLFVFFQNITCFLSCNCD